jgi:hypothetical protein
MLGVNKEGWATASSFWKESPKKDFCSHPRHTSMQEDVQWRTVPTIWRLETVKWIKSERLRWAGYIIRMRESDPARKSTSDLLLGERTSGKAQEETQWGSGERNEGNGC